MSLIKNTNMSSINIKIRNKPNRNGECPVIPRITKDRKSKIITLGMHCKMAEWDHRNNNFKRSHPNYSQRNNKNQN